MTHLGSLKLLEATARVGLVHGNLRAEQLVLAAHKPAHLLVHLLLEPLTPKVRVWTERVGRLGAFGVAAVIDLCACRKRVAPSVDVTLDGLLLVFAFFFFFFFLFLLVKFEVRVVVAGSRPLRAGVAGRGPARGEGAPLALAGEEGSSRPVKAIWRGRN